MQETPKNAVLDRLMITRIYDPVFEDCDVFLPEFRNDVQIANEMQEEITVHDVGPCDWRQCNEADLDDFVGEEVQKGIMEEKGVRYELQMWKRAA
jgi:dihydrofolate reductase